MSDTDIPSASAADTQTETYSTISTQASLISQIVKNALDRLEATDELSYTSGISLLSVKNDLMLSYVHHLVLLCISKVSGQTTSDDEKIVKELVRIRVVMEKLRPLEGKLKYQIEKLVRKAETDAVARPAAGEEEDENVINDPLAFKPNPSALISGRNGGYVSQSDDDASSDGEAGSKPASGIYKPPRLAPTPYLEAPSKGAKAKRRPPPTTSAFLTDMASTLNANTPYIEATSGLSVTPSMNSRRAKKMNEMQDYEEDMMTRISMSKKEGKKRRDDEAEVALGGGGTLDTGNKRGVRGTGGFGVEFDELLSTIERGGKKKNGVLQRAGGGEYEALRNMRNERKHVPAEHTGSQGGKRKSKGGFDKAIDRQAKRQKKSRS